MENHEIIRDYEICEFIKEETDGLKTSIFDLKLDALVFEKMFIMFEKVAPAQRKLDEEQVTLQTKKDNLLRTLDFKELTGESRPTIAMKDAVMQPQLQEHEDKIKSLKQDLECYKNKLTILNDLIKNQRLMIKIESALEVEE